MYTHYLGITDGYDPEEYEFFGRYGDDKDTIPVESLDNLTFFANLNTPQIQRLKSCCDIALNSQDITEYIEKAAEAITEDFGQKVANIITLELINRWDKKSSDDELSVSQACDIIQKSVDEAHFWAELLCNQLSKLPQMDIDRQNRTLHTLVAIIPPDIKYIPLAAICKKTNRLTYCDAYYVATVRDFFYLMAIVSVKGEQPIKKCKNCGKYFVPSVKKDEIYCLSCRDVSYDSKIREDEVLRSYRRIYKTQCARKVRNSHRPRINEKFEQWKHLAKIKRNDCKAGRISLEEMEEAISSQEWMNG